MIANVAVPSEVKSFDRRQVISPFEREGVLGNLFPVLGDLDAVAHILPTVLAVFSALLTGKGINFISGEIE